MSVLHSNKHFERAGSAAYAQHRAYKTADDFYSGALLSMNSKGSPIVADREVAPLGTMVGWPFVGICCQQRTTPPNSRENVAISIGGRIINTFCIGVTDFSDVGRIVFCQTDNISDMTLTPVGSPVGIIRRFRMAACCDVELFLPQEAEEQMWRLTPPR